MLFNGDHTHNFFHIPRKSRILYAVQATGNGHIARALELMPFLQQYGTVDIFLSGSNSNLSFDLPVKYRSKGVSLFYGNRGGLDYWKMMKDISLKRIWREANNLPVEKYDIVINDFESITSLACKLKKVKSVNFGHQASFQSSNSPRPSFKNLSGEFILRYYATATDYIGLHFEQYDDFIFSPVIKRDILEANPVENGHITVYLSHYSDDVVAAQLNKLNGVRFEVFSKKVKTAQTVGNITFIPVSNAKFNQSMINSKGIITGAGFETPAEALYMGKKLLCLPIKGQYEQLCNAEALKGFNVPIINSIDDNFATVVDQWWRALNPRPLKLSHSTAEIVDMAIERARNLQESFDDDVLPEVVGYAL
jgi:uncharacterized protein (TIGR00661 family)